MFTIPLLTPENTIYLDESLNEDDDGTYSELLTTGNYTKSEEDDLTNSQPPTGVNNPGGGELNTTISHLATTELMLTSQAIISGSQPPHLNTWQTTLSSAASTQQTPTFRSEELPGQIKKETTLLIAELLWLIFETTTFNSLFLFSLNQNMPLALLGAAINMFAIKPTEKVGSCCVVLGLQIC